MEQYEEWVKRLEAMDRKINSLKTWDSYAERLQSRYDEILKEDPRLKKEKK